MRFDETSVDRIFRCSVDLNLWNDIWVSKVEKCEVGSEVTTCEQQSFFGEDERNLHGLLLQRLIHLPKLSLVLVALSLSLLQLQTLLLKLFSQLIFQQLREKWSKSCQSTSVVPELPLRLLQKSSHPG